MSILVIQLPSSSFLCFIVVSTDDDHCPQLRLMQTRISIDYPLQTSATYKSVTINKRTNEVLILEHEEGINKLGLLDFQDALIGSPLYDLVSILEDARIDIPRDFALECVQYYALAKNIDPEDALINYHILGAQRNLRILGIFARKYIRDKDDTYLQYIPRVLKYLEYDVSHPALEPLKNWLLKTKII